MGDRIAKILCGAALILFMFLAGSPRLYASGMAVFNVKDYGATGNKADDAEAAIQKAIDAASDAGGGTVYLPPGSYTSGTLRLRSHVNIYIEAGATLYATEDWHAFDVQKVHSKDALFFGEGVEDISIGGRGTVDGQSRYVWRPDNFEHDFNHKILMLKLGKSTMRSFPAGDLNNQVYPHLLWLGRSNNVRITGLQFLHSPSWSFALYACSHVIVDGVYIYTSLKEAVWADGIDMDSCRDVSISNSTIATGDDCIIFISGIREWGPAYPCENITVTNCRLSSASAAIKFSEGNSLLIHNIVITNCAIFNCNRGLSVAISDGGTISDVVISNITMDLHRFDWFWAGDGNAFEFELRRQHEWNHTAEKPNEPPAGKLHNFVIHDVIIHSQGTSIIEGHFDSWLEGVTFENIKFFLSADPNSPYDNATHALIFRWARNLKLRNLEVHWEGPRLDKWQSALYVEDADQVQVDGFSGNSAWPEKNIPAVEFKNVTNATVRNSNAVPGTNVFLNVSGAGSHDIRLFGNDFHQAKIPYQTAPEVKRGSVIAIDNFLLKAS